MTVQVRAFSRLHFGLLEICPGQPHCYGGVGLMVEEPTSTIRGTLGRTADLTSLAIDANPYWSERIHAVARRWMLQGGHTSLPIGRMDVENPPQAHVGLGSGTQFGCSVAALLTVALHAHAWREHPPSMTEIFPDSRSVGEQCDRGKRSHIGLEGFRSGGLIVDFGQAAQSEPSLRSAAESPTRTHAYPFPKEWRIVTACDRTYQGESGKAEAEMFERCAGFPNANRNEMLRLVNQELLPAIAESHWKNASRAIGGYGALAGQIFQTQQGGIYRSKSIASTIDQLKGWGVLGAGQSSWGPTLFAVTRDEEQAQWITQRLEAILPVGSETRMVRAAGPADYAFSSSS
jgi:beta-RFAP synthase